jgi:hypothetical protein
MRLLRGLLNGSVIAVAMSGSSWQGNRFVEAWGEGPIGVHSIDAEHVVVADSDANALILLNHVTHRVVDRRSMDREFSRERSTSSAAALKLFWNDPPEPGIPFPRPSRGIPSSHPQLISFVTCPTCTFGIASMQWIDGGSGQEDPRFARNHKSFGCVLLKLDFRRPLASSSLANELSAGTVTMLPFDRHLRSGGMLAMAPDGSRAYVADLEARCVWTFDPRNASSSSPSSTFRRLATFPIAPRSVSLSPSADELIVTLRRRHVVRVDLASLSMCFVELPTDCDGDNERQVSKSRSGQGNYRRRGLCEAIVDPQQSSGSTLLALTHIHGRGGTLLELSGASCPSSSAATTSRASPSCRLLAGNSTSGSGWRDGWGAAAQFTRPHSMTFASHQSAVVLTDIDNRALRKVSLGDTSTGFPDVSSIVYAGRQQQVRRSLSDVSVKFKKLKGKRSWEEANRRCAERGARLCTVDEIKSTSPESESSSAATEAFWTMQSCESCWHPRPGMCGCRVPLGGASFGKRLLLEESTSSSSCPVAKSGTCEGNYECKWGSGFHMALEIHGPTEISVRCLPDENAYEVRCCY